MGARTPRPKIVACPQSHVQGTGNFSGSFQEIERTPFLRQSFEQDFLPRLSMLGYDTLYLARTRAALQALDWCTENGFLFKDQVLGALPDEETMSTTTLKSYMEGSIPKYILKPSDESHAIINGLRMRTSVEWHSTTWGMDLRHGRALDLGQPKRAPLPEVAVSPYDEGQGLFFVVNKGEHFAKVLRPHVKDSKHTVWNPNSDDGHVLLDVEELLEPWLGAGYSLRMSARGKSPSFISAASVLGRRRPPETERPVKYAN